MNLLWCCVVAATIGYLLGSINFAVIVSRFWQWCIFSILPKILVDFVFLMIASWKLHAKRKMLAFLPTEIIQVPMIVFAVPAGITGMFRWK